MDVSNSGDRFKNYQVEDESIQNNRNFDEEEEDYDYNTITNNHHHHEENKVNDKNHIDDGNYDINRQIEFK